MGVDIEWARDYAESGSEYVTFSSDFMKELLSEYSALLAENERLRAERVDLEQFRQAQVALSDYAYERHGNMDHPHCIEADRLLALIDAHKGE